jgi:hypothetical protein
MKYAIGIVGFFAIYVFMTISNNPKTSRLTISRLGQRIQRFALHYDWIDIKSSGILQLASAAISLSFLYDLAAGFFCARHDFVRAL